jgi:hypothetical protein
MDRSPQRYSTTKALPLCTTASKNKRCGTLVRKRAIVRFENSYTNYLICSVMISSLSGSNNEVQQLLYCYGPMPFFNERILRC